jgi:hypothetical protein
LDRCHAERRECSEVPDRPRTVPYLPGRTVSLLAVLRAGGAKPRQSRPVQRAPLQKQRDPTGIGASPGLRRIPPKPQVPQELIRGNDRFKIIIQRKHPRPANHADDHPPSGQHEQTRTTPRHALSHTTSPEAPSINARQAEQPQEKPRFSPSTARQSIIGTPTNPPSTASKVSNACASSATT